MKHAVERIHFVAGSGMPTNRTVAARRASA